MPVIPDSVYSKPLPGLKFLERSKVRDIYELPDSSFLLAVASDWVGVFGFDLPAFVEKKGEVLNALNIFWRTEVFRGAANDPAGFLHAFGSAYCHNLIGYGKNILPFLPKCLRNDVSLKRRAVVIRRLKMIPVGAVVRRYLTGRAWKIYRESTGAGTHGLPVVFGHVLPRGLCEGSRLAEPMFTPRIKTEVDVGDDLPLSEERVTELYGRVIKWASSRLYTTAESFGVGKGIVVAEAEFEWGRDDCNRVCLGGELIVPDSSLFWDVGEWQAALKEGRSPRSYDQQVLQEWGETVGIDKLRPDSSNHIRRVHCLQVPGGVLERTRDAFLGLFDRLTGFSLDEFQERFLD